MASYNLPFYEVSAKSDDKIADIFTDIAKLIKKEYDKAPNSFGSNEGRKESCLELLVIISNQIASEYKSLDIELTQGIPELIKSKSASIFSMLDGKLPVVVCL